MSGLYNLVFGNNLLAGPFLGALGIHPNDVPRFRDCFLFHDGQSLVVYTRTGGGNREEYREQNEDMTRRAGYLRDEDDSFDSTYALFHFAVPETIKPHVPSLLEKGYGVDPGKRWKEALDQLGKR
jgi:hypothetical protein